MPHPLRTAGALIASGALDFSGDMTAVSPDGAAGDSRVALSIVGVGFCLKPMNPPCLSGRPNHDCHYLENLLRYESSDIPVPCRQCAIRELGTMTLKAGAAFYVMTSARDILLDVFAPALDERRFSSGLFVLCRYSLRPFSAGLLASGMSARLFPFERGDCQDYRTWLKADRGIKDEQTGINESNYGKIVGFLNAAATEPPSAAQFQRHGNVLYARMAVEQPRERNDAESRGCAGNETR